MSGVEQRRASITTDPRWASVLARDTTSDGCFFYSVRTTGVYCRPSCAARTPRPENVAFHASVAEAEQAGFRPCRRCRPNQPASARLHAPMIAELCRHIEAAEQAPRLAELAARAGMSPYHLHRIFKAMTGLTPRAYAAAHRAERVRGELARGRKVTEALYDAGYGSSGRFYEQSNDLLGMTPGRYRAGGAGLHIRYAIAACSLGSALVAATQRGVCAILIGDHRDALVADLRGRFPRAEQIAGDADFAQLVFRVIELIDSAQPRHDLPLDVQGTVFQQRVWQALREIPPGRTATYAEIACRIGAPTSARAVARACAANPLAVAIPCHRAVRADGNLAGYRWGIGRKRALLEREARGPTDEPGPRR